MGTQRSHSRSPTHSVRSHSPTTSQMSTTISGTSPCSALGSPGGKGGEEKQTSTVENARVQAAVEDLKKQYDRVRARSDAVYAEEDINELNYTSPRFKGKSQSQGHDSGSESNQARAGSESGESKENESVHSDHDDDTESDRCYSDDACSDEDIDVDSEDDNSYSTDSDAYMRYYHSDTETDGEQCLCNYAALCPSCVKEAEAGYNSSDAESQHDALERPSKTSADIEPPAPVKSFTFGASNNTKRSKLYLPPQPPALRPAKPLVPKVTQTIPLPFFEEIALPMFPKLTEPIAFPKFSNTGSVRGEEGKAITKKTSKRATLMITRKSLRSASPSQSHTATQASLSDLFADDGHANRDTAPGLIAKSKYVPPSFNNSRKSPSADKEDEVPKLVTSSTTTPQESEQPAQQPATETLSPAADSNNQTSTPIHASKTQSHKSSDDDCVCSICTRDSSHDNIVIPNLPRLRIFEELTDGLESNLDDTMHRQIGEGLKRRREVIVKDINRARAKRIKKEKKANKHIADADAKVLAKKEKVAIARAVLEEASKGLKDACEEHSTAVAELHELRAADLVIGDQTAAEMIIAHNKQVGKFAAGFGWREGSA
ncbi:hypothetical protein Q8F55_001739 [Vanrija albida]|uniref:BZIP domain-containing protein n=1 Tax=Vanrija albida TaxID=181172 RepID=A0ABR3Q8J5_9TREE